MRIGKSDNRHRRHRHSAQLSWSSGVRISAKICSNRHHGNWLNFDRNAVTVDALKMLLCQLNDFRVFGKLQFARWSLFNARPQQDIVVFDQKDFETTTLRFPLRIQRNLWKRNPSGWFLRDRVENKNKHDEIEERPSNFPVVTSISPNSLRNASPMATALRLNTDQEVQWRMRKTSLVPAVSSVVSPAPSSTSAGDSLATGLGGSFSLATVTAFSSSSFSSFCCFRGTSSGTSAAALRLVVRPLILYLGLEMDMFLL